MKMNATPKRPTAGGMRLRFTERLRCLGDETESMECTADRNCTILSTESGSMGPVWHSSAGRRNLNSYHAGTTSLKDDRSLTLRPEGDLTDFSVSRPFQQRSPGPPCGRMAGSDGADPTAGCKSGGSFGNAGAGAFLSSGASSRCG